MSLSENIRKLRLEKNLTQEQLAAMLGISAQAISKWETSETYPDGTLLVPLARALDTSLDILFDNNIYSVKNLSSYIINLIYNTPQKEQFELVRDICWQIEKGLFNSIKPFEKDYEPNEIKNLCYSSSILNDYGFTQVSNGESPFFAVFPETRDGYSKAIGDGEEMRKVFECLASPQTMRAIIFIHKNKPNFVFESEVLAEECEINADKIDAVMRDLLSLRIVCKQELEIDGNMRTLYYSAPSSRMIALLLLAHEYNYQKAFCVTAWRRSKPYLK